MTASSSELPSERPEAGSITESEYHRLLSSARRRALLDVLRDGSTPMDVETLAMEVREEEQRTGSADQDAMDRIAITLHHVHLPKLDEVGIVDYDQSATCVVSFQDLPTR